MLKTLPRIGAQEYETRWNAVRAYMEQNDLDAVIAYGDDRFTYGPAHIRWLTDIPVCFEPMLMLFVGKEEPVLLVGPESDDWAAIRGHVKDIRVLEEMTHPDEVYLFSKIESLGKVANELAAGKAFKRVGVAPIAYMGAEIFASIKKTFADAEIVDIEFGLSMLRAIKTPAEIEVIKYAYQIATEACKVGIDAVKVGACERDVVAEIEYCARKMGAEGFGIDTMVASGINSYPILAKTTFKEIGNNEIVNLTIAPRYEGYHAAIARTLIMGEPDERAVKQIEAEAKAQIECAKMMKPGVLGSEVEAHAREIMKAAGFETGFMYSGIHSVGVIEFEAPIYGPGIKEIIKENMFLSLDVPNYDRSKFGSRTENGYFITSEGAELLTDVELVIRK